MKKILITVLTLSLLFTLVACGSSAPEVTQPDEQPTVSDTQPETPTTPEVEQEEETPAEPEPTPEVEQPPVVEETPEVTPDPIPVETPEQTETPEPEPAPEQTPEVKPEPSPTPEVKPEPEQPVVTTEPTPEVIPEPEVEETPEVVETPMPEEIPEVEATGDSFVEGERHSYDIVKAGTTVTRKDGTKVVLAYKYGVLGAGQNVDIWSNCYAPKTGFVFEEGKIGPDSAIMSKSPYRNEMFSGKQWKTIQVNSRPASSIVGDYDGEAFNEYWIWDADAFNHGTGKNSGAWIWQGGETA